MLEQVTLHPVPWGSFSCGPWSSRPAPTSLPDRPAVLNGGAQPPALSETGDGTDR